jgi:hypothetical protein
MEKANEGVTSALLMPVLARLDIVGLQSGPSANPGEDAGSTERVWSHQ